MLISKLVFTAEVWYNVTARQYLKLEEIDQLFLKKIFQLPNSVPTLSLYVECGIMPVRFIIKYRRLMYYWHILHLNDDELVKKFYLAQSMRPVKKDWALQVKDDISDINLRLGEDDIKRLSKEEFQKIVKKKMNAHVTEYFLNVQAQKVKTQHYVIDGSMKPAPYLFSDKLTVSEIQTLFKVRSRTISVKGNQSSSFINNMKCRICLVSSETQDHVINCERLKKDIQYLNTENLKPEMIFGSLDDQEEFTKVYHLLWMKRKELLNLSQPPASEAGGPLHQ